MNDVVRNKAQRRQLEGAACPECVAVCTRGGSQFLVAARTVSLTPSPPPPHPQWYAGLGLSDEEIRAKLKGISRHRHVQAPTEVDRRYYDVGFLNTQDDPRQHHLIGASAERVKYTAPSVRGGRRGGFATRAAVLTLPSPQQFSNSVGDIVPATPKPVTDWIPVKPPRS